MRKFLRVLFAVVLGLIVGSVVNMALITVSGKVIAPPTGANVTTMEGLKAAIHLFEPKHFLFPFLAHALGTLVGTLVAAWLAPARSAIPPYVVGALFLAGGIANVFMLPSPLWFTAVDLLFAYVPAAWAGRTMALRTAARRSPVGL